ncbi:MAG TPA: tRNA preQ1(34) S-adenosylmethionine ribosyltransferase-isomerase QueA [Bryobacteraceae bacterium]|nr:tRNA preQ1(34) S-adenosylmethionine ribosyltransferase-isomerase QueA [Bryobacteraceae bacterium]
MPRIRMYSLSPASTKYSEAHSAAGDLARLTALLVSDFDYDLPEELIAQEPPLQRGASRMLVLSRQRQTFHDDLFANFHRYLHPGDCLVLNNTRVFPARLRARRNHADGAEIEVFLVRARHDDESIWRALVRPAKRVRHGDTLLFDESLHAVVIEEGEFGERILQFHAAAPLAGIFDRLGQTPLPPYIHRMPDAADRERYQTVFAEKRGSVAAPTAGLHFTEQMLDACREAGAGIARVTLHVGLGTFAPLREQNLAKIQLHEEYFDIGEQDAAKMCAAKRLICIGTTSVRTVETAALRGGLQRMQGETNLFISPGFRFLATDALLTNFHLPQSSLLILVSAFAGRDLVLAAYRHAVAERYRFFSYGDCMLIE